MLNFLPILFFLGMSYGIYTLSKKSAHGPLLLTLVVAYVGFIFLGDLNVAFYIAQAAAAVLLFFLMVTFLGHKTSLTTIIIICGVIALNPGLIGGLGLVLGIASTVIVGIFSIMKEQNRTIQQVSLEVASTTGLMGTAPDLDSLPDRKEVGSNTKLFSIAPFFFFPYLLVGIITLIA